MVAKVTDAPLRRAITKETSDGMPLFGELPTKTSVAGIGSIWRFTSTLVSHPGLRGDASVANFAPETYRNLLRCDATHYIGQMLITISSAELEGVQEQAFSR